MKKFLIIAGTVVLISARTKTPFFGVNHQKTGIVALLKMWKILIVLSCLWQTGKIS